jgi:hypothetical protein
MIDLDEINLAPMPSRKSAKASRAWRKNALKLAEHARSGGPLWLRQLRGTRMRKIPRPTMPGDKRR